MRTDTKPPGLYTACAPHKNIHVCSACIWSMGMLMSLQQNLKGLLCVEQTRCPVVVVVVTASADSVPTDDGSASWWDTRHPSKKHRCPRLYRLTPTLVGAGRGVLGGWRDVQPLTAIHGPLVSTLRPVPQPAPSHNPPKVHRMHS